MRSISVILVCADDQVSVKDAFAGACIQADFRFTKNRTELIEYLQNSNEQCPRPNIILIDFNMRDMGGSQALGWIKFRTEYRKIPVVIYTTSCKESEIQQCFQAGASTLLTMCAKFGDLAEKVKTFAKYQMDVC